MQVLWWSVDNAYTLDDWSALQFNMKIHPLESDQYTLSLCIYVQNMQMCMQLLHKMFVNWKNEIGEMCMWLEQKD